MSTRMMRLPQVYGRGNPIPVGKTKFFEDIVLRDDGDPYIPGTKVRRLRLANMGERMRVAFEDEVHALAEAIRKERDAAA
jgi:hypothetical protein